MQCDDCKCSCHSFDSDDWDEEYDSFDEDWEENRLMRIIEDCHCGAYQIDSNGKIYQIADCIC